MFVFDRASMICRNIAWLETHSKKQDVHDEWSVGIFIFKRRAMVSEP